MQDLEMQEIHFREWMMQMRVVKRIGLFIFYPLFFLGVGFYGGVRLTHFFYPGEQYVKYEEQSYLEGAVPGQQADGQRTGGQQAGETQTDGRQTGGQQADETQADGQRTGGQQAGETQEDGQRTGGQQSGVLSGGQSAAQLGGQSSERLGQQSAGYAGTVGAENFVTVEDGSGGGRAAQAAAASETLCVDTEYVLEETNLLDDSVVETTVRLPDKYVGLNREQFLTVMETYQAAPPLAEQERGFVSLEVISFSRARVVVRMNYLYIQPSSCFYLAAYDNRVWVYLEDRKTVYIETEIRVDSLPEELQRQIIQMMWVENQEELYNFLESYSS